MINLTDDAKIHLDKYLQQMRSCLKSCKTVDADEIEQNITEHIETELKETTEPISFSELDVVLKKLGSPAQWLPEEEISWWRKIIMRLRTGPEDWRLAYISFGLLVLSGLFCFYNKEEISFILIAASFILSRATLSVVDNHNELKAQKWLIYPLLIIVYGFAIFWLLAWPIAFLELWADEIESSKKIDSFPWNVNDPDLCFWPVALIFIAAVTALWWLILGLIHKKKPILLQTIFRPFLDGIKPKWVNWFIGISAGLLIVCSTAGILMIKYHGWYYFLKRIFE